MNRNGPKQGWQDQIKKWKDAASQFISNEERDNDAEPNEYASVIELEPEYYERCRQLAEIRGTSVNAVVHYMLGQQFALQSKERKLKSNIGQIESNPLLALDGLTGRKTSRDSREQEAIGHEFA
ncbi:hypothetical protein [Paenibacillus ginsengarvi]|uniref:Uncharacterized protein n=1 Tax=Paenibacillus ginsengarvi TaxID=400777 RepID=A0A3B0CFV0_9BACL|nr:hypothetical protein [Paenibacillus ginsengarvi]RKN84282.1 hypothetical protein D7M11_14895 [Paenibacillus ginsengarvi]